MNKTLLLVFIVIMGICPVEIFAWQGMPTPPLHVDGRWLKDPTGKNIMLHGWFQATGGWFNGQLFKDPTTFTPEDCAGALNIYKAEAEFLTRTSPMFGRDHGWYSNFVRIWLPSEGWDDNGLVDTALLDRAMNNLMVPYIEYCKSRGLYVVLIGSARSGETYMSALHKSNLIKYWARMAAYPAIKNADNVMFEICNEPVAIESVLGNGQWGSVSDAHDKAVQTYFQDICDTIRGTGADNIIWVPGLIWQARLQNFAKYPISGKNIGYAGHRYPIGANNVQEIINNFNSDWKICSDKYPIIVTEGSWHTMGPDQGLRTGTTENFGSAVRNLYDNTGNISWICGFVGEAIGGLDAGKQPNEWGYPEINSGRAGFEWWPTYAWCAPDDGTPKFDHASVTANNPKQIQVTMSKSIVDSIYFDGFTVKIDNQVVTIDSVVLGDTNQLVINLNVSILKDHEIQLSYSNGNVVSIYEKNLVDFSDTLVDNLLNGASPRIVELKTSKDGNTLIAKFNIKMQLPSDISALALKAEYNGNTSIPLNNVSFSNNDSTLLAFPLDTKVYADYKLLLSYSGNNISTSNNSLLKVFSDLPVTNYSQGLPVQIDTGKIGTDGISGIFEFSKPLATVTGESSFALKVNKISVSFLDFYSFNNTIRFTIPNTLHYGDTITVSYTPGKVTATDGGILEGFSNFPVTNPVTEPQWLAIPGKIQAEKYYSQSGISTENTGDIGGGLNVGWIDNGDWLEYGIENNTSDSLCEIAFRVASPSSDGKFEFYLDNIKKGQVTVPNTGGWQAWQSVVSSIIIGPGKHYFKIIVTSSGFNLNYYDIKKNTSASAYLSSKTSNDGKIISVAFNTKIADASVHFSDFVVTVNNTNNAVTKAALNATKDTLLLTLTNRIVKSADVITITYQPGLLFTTYGFPVAGFNAKRVTNLVLVPSFVSAATSSSGTTLQVNFSQLMASPLGQASAFTVTVNSKSNQVTKAALLTTNKKNVILTLSSAICFGDTVSINYTPGALVSTIGVPVPAFSAKVTNNSTLPAAIESITNYNIGCYPNPFSNQLLISNTNDYKSVAISDMHGKIVIQLQLNQTGITTINTSKLNNGVYVVILSNNTSQLVLKVLKQ